jgi:hypothetical protein
VWEDSFDEEVAFEVDAVLRDAAFDGSDRVRAHHHRSELLPLPAFSPAVRHAVYEAIHEAARGGVGHVGPQHLLAALLALPGSTACRLLHEWKVPDYASLGQAVRTDPTYRCEDGARSTWAVSQLTLWRVLPAAGPRLPRWPWHAAVRLLERRLRRPYRGHGARYGHPILLLIELDATSKAVHTGHAVVTATDVLLSVMDLHEQVALAGKALPDEVARWNEAGAILAVHGLEGRTVTRTAAQLVPAPSDQEGDLAGLPTRGWPPLKVLSGAPAPGRTAVAALREASLSAYRLGHPYAGTTHLLGALLTQPDGPVVRLLRELGVNPDSVRSDVVRRLESAGSP